MVQLAPSIYAADYYSLGEQMKVMEEEGISILHLDVMDGQFVPGFSFGQSSDRTAGSILTSI